MTDHQFTFLVAALCASAYSTAMDNIPPYLPHHWAARVGYGLGHVIIILGVAWLAARIFA